MSALNAVKTSCANGHEFTEANTYRDPKGNDRHCRECRREADGRRPRISTEITRPCATCGTEFTFIRTRGKSYRHCSDPCRKEAARKASREYEIRKRLADS
jgi:hypothetical protein